MLSIGELARRTRVKIPTIRYYEQKGLIAAPQRSEGNQRRYGTADLDRLTFIKHARDLGLSIGAIRELIDLSSDPQKSCAEADRIASEHLGSIRNRIARLQRLESELARISSSCRAGKVADCYVLRALSDHDLCEQEH